MRATRSLFHGRAAAGISLRSIGLCLCLLLALPGASSTVSVTSPAPGTVVTTTTVTVIGNASARAQELASAGHSDLLAGTLQNLTLGTNGTVFILPRVGIWSKDPANPVLPVGAGYMSSGVAPAAAIRSANPPNFRLWIAGFNGATWSVGYHTSNNGVAWADGNGGAAVLGLGAGGKFDSQGVRPGSVILDGATYRMWYSGSGSDGITRIGYATSPNGITWTRQNGGDQVLNPGGPGGFDSGGVAYPSVIKAANGTFMMWYAGLINNTANLWQIGLASSANGIAWTRLNASKPVLPLGGTGFDKGGLYAPEVLREGNLYRMWYVGISAAAIPVYEVGFADSTDGIVWRRSTAPVLNVGAAPAFDELGLREIAVVRDANQYRMWYAGADATTMLQGGYATAPADDLEGNFTSPEFDAGNQVNWTTVNWDADAPGGSEVNVSLRSSRDLITWSAWKEATQGGVPPVPAGEFFQYKVRLFSPDGYDIPSFRGFWANYTAVLRVEVSFDNGTWLLAAGTDPWTTTLDLVEGTNLIYLRVTDTTPFLQYATHTITVDAAKPTGEMVINDDLPLTNSLDVLLRFKAKDRFGVARLKIGLSTNLSGEPWRAFTPLVNASVTAGEGVKIIYGQLEDGNGLLSEIMSDSIILDQTPPDGTMVINQNATYTTSVAVTLDIDVRDANGVDLLRVANSASELSQARWEPYSRDRQWLLSGSDGDLTAMVEVHDRAGNTVVLTDTITLDTVRPTGTVTVTDREGVLNTTKIPLVLVAQDINGVKDMQVSLDPTFAGARWSPFADGLTLSVPPLTGDLTVYTQFRDSAGLTSLPASDTTVIDLREFNATVTLNHGARATGAREATLVVDLRDRDGTEQMRFSEDRTFAGASWTGVQELTPVVLSTKDGNKTVYVQFRDSYGLLSDPFSATIRLDTTPPTLVVPFPTPGAVLQNGTVEVTGTSVDASRIARVEYLVDDGDWAPVDGLKDRDGPTTWNITVDLTPDPGKHSIAFRAVDELGNPAVVNITFTYKPINPPKPRDKPFIPGFGAVGLAAALIAAAGAFGRLRPRD